MYLRPDRSFTRIRNKTTEKVIENKILVGDVLILKAGDVSPVDGIIFESNNLLVDEYPITGNR